MQNIIASVCMSALLPTGVFAQAPGKRTTSPVPSPLSRSISSVSATLPAGPGVDPRYSGTLPAARPNINGQRRTRYPNGS
jgi:hypothetical protein